jgi:4-carboxymuconolactone decarboxylase
MSNAPKLPPFTVAPERMPPLTPEKMTDKQKAVAAELASGRRGSVRGPFNAFLRSPTLFDHVQKLGAYIRYDSVIELRIRELAALMTARHWTNQYEWFAHVPHAVKAGINAETIEAIEQGRRPKTLAEDEQLVYDLVTELLANKGVSDATYAAAVQRYKEDGVVELVSVVGYYALLAMVMNVARTATPDGLSLTPLPQQLNKNA